MLSAIVDIIEFNILEFNKSTTTSTPLFDKWEKSAESWVATARQIAWVEYLQRGYEIKSNNIVFGFVHYNKQKVRLELRGIFFQLTRKNNYSIVF